MYGCQPCPKCKGKYRAAFKREHGRVIECDDCGHKEKVDEENYKIYGLITIKGVTRKIILNAEYGGVIQDPWGNARTGFSLTGKLNRSDFGLSFGLVSDAGGVGLANEVKILANVQLVKQIEELV